MMEDFDFERIALSPGQQIIWLDGATEDENNDAEFARQLQNTFDQQDVRSAKKQAQTSFASSGKGKQRSRAEKISRRQREFKGKAQEWRKQNEQNERV